jgi:hypothetical protein
MAKFLAHLGINRQGGKCHGWFFRFNISQKWDKFLRHGELESVTSIKNKPRLTSGPIAENSPEWQFSSQELSYE